jgi:hypothetical protein
MIRFFFRITSFLDTALPTFVPHPLNFVTSVRTEPVRMYDSNGVGVAVDDLDIVVNNLQTPAVVFENQLCAGKALEVDLRLPSSKNTHALGARLTLVTSDGTLTRAVSGYASGDPACVHFGLPAGSRVERLEIRSPDDASSTISDLDAGQRLTITRR